MRADACCRLLYQMQRQLTFGVGRFAAESGAEADILGSDPAGTLDALARFVGRTDDELSSCQAAAKDLRGDIERLNTWIKVCGESPIPVDSVRMAPGAAAPRIKTALQAQRAFLSARMSLLPASIALHRSKRDIPQADLNAIRDLYAHVTQQGSSSTTDPDFWKKSSNRNDVKLLLAGIRQLTNQASPRTN
jgi:hypothetical protein